MLSAADLARSVVAHMDENGGDITIPDQNGPVRPTTLPFASDVGPNRSTTSTPTSVHADHQYHKEADKSKTRPGAQVPVERPLAGRSVDYLPIENYGLIGNMHTAALVSTDASVDFMCLPRFDSPFVFGRLLDHCKGGYFQIAPTHLATTKQQYLPNSCVLVTRFMFEDGAAQVTDFMHVPDNPAHDYDLHSAAPVGQPPSADPYATRPGSGSAMFGPAVPSASTNKPQYPWLIRMVETMRGRVSFSAACFPAFNYALSSHKTTIHPAAPSHLGAAVEPSSLPMQADRIPPLPSMPTVEFSSDNLTLDLRIAAHQDACLAGSPRAMPTIAWEMVHNPDMLGPGVRTTFDLYEGQQLWFVLRKAVPPAPATAFGVPEMAAVPDHHAPVSIPPPIVGSNSVRTVEPQPTLPPIDTHKDCSTQHHRGGLIGHLMPSLQALERPGSRFALDRHDVLGSSPMPSPDGTEPQPIDLYVGSPPNTSTLLSQGLESVDLSFGDSRRTPPPVHDIHASLRKPSFDLFAGLARLGAPPMPHVHASPQTPCHQRLPLALLQTTDPLIEPKPRNLDPPLTGQLLHSLLRQTLRFFNGWASHCTYEGRWREIVIRSALTLKLLTYAPTGAVVAAPTFSLPEQFGGNRTWDYRYTWIRDAAFVVYAFIRLGFIGEARNFMRFIELVCHDRSEDGSLNIMYSISGSSDLPELELTHLEGYKGSRPVRVGNAASKHLQLDIYGALMDAIYLMNKFSSPIGFDMWQVCRSFVNFVVDHWREPDMSIWEVRGNPQNFVYSKILCWVAVDRGIRLAEKRVLPCPDRNLWLEMRDAIYLDVMDRGWNCEGQYFQQSYENPGLDASVLIMPLVFFISPVDPRMLSTVAAILRPPEQGGLTMNGQVHRYLPTNTDDGIDSNEGSFTMCTFWLVEALTRAGLYIDKHRHRALYAFEQTLSYGNHLGLFSEEVSPAGESCGNFPQAFTHLGLISSAFNLDRVFGPRRSLGSEP
ncbi:Six-hairpin glycosidase-like protein [Blastocladiella britannica]|nr:Six-hairpin glycosidase-like protein [Blastocladiella britannica]